VLRCLDSLLDVVLVLGLVSIRARCSMLWCGNLLFGIDMLVNVCGWSAPWRGDHWFNIDMIVNASIMGTAMVWSAVHCR
jgi:hypothetical protein